MSEFGPQPVSLRTEAAIARWVVQKDSDRTRRFRRMFVFGMTTLFAVIAIAASWVAHVYTTPSSLAYYHSRFLAFHDPAALNHGADGNYSVARVLSDRRSLYQDTNLTEEIAGTERSFDLMVNNASYIRHAQNENFRRIVKRGGRLRIILWDYFSPANQQMYDAFNHAIGQSSGESREAARNVHGELARIARDVAADPTTYRGSFEFRWNDKPLFYTMWIRDWDGRDARNALGHLGVHFYRGQEHWPCFRVSPLNGRDLLENMRLEFEHAWATLEANSAEGDIADFESLRRE